TGNLEELKEIADMSFDPNRFRENMEAGYSYPNSYGYLAKAYGPNDILGIAYLQAIKNTSIQPHCIRRTNVFHGSELSNNCSAKAIRLALKNGQDVTVATPMAPLLTPVDWEDYYPYLRTLLLTLPKSYLQSVLLVSEGIETHLIKQAKQSETAEEFFRNAIVRRYTKARIQRTCLHIMAHTPATLKPNASDINFVRILAHNLIGQQYLKTLRKKEGLIIASKFMQIPERYREAEYRATVCYSQGFDNEKRFAMIQKEIYGQYQ
ncbi:MAG: nucleotidyltransferase family protein, partial [Erysipelotrichaceae bacterium]|nr:nucleotidyltransferase family protein [Erysipelotrichaceae bacterium]